MSALSGDDRAAAETTEWGLWGRPGRYEGTHEQAEALAIARQTLAHEGTGYVPPWEDLTAVEQRGSTAHAAHYLTAMRATPMFAELAKADRLAAELEQARLAEQRVRDLLHHWKTNGNTAEHDQRAAELQTALDGDGTRPAVMTSSDLNGTFDRIAQAIDQWLDGKIAPQDALNEIHEQVGDR